MAVETIGPLTSASRAIKVLVAEVAMLAVQVDELQYTVTPIFTAEFGADNAWGAAVYAGENATVTDFATDSNWGANTSVLFDADYAASSDWAPTVV